MNAQTLLVIFLGCMSVSDSYGVEKFCLTMAEEKARVLMIRNAGSKDALRNIGQMMEQSSITAFDTKNKPDQYFIWEDLTHPQCVYIKPDEVINLKVNGEETSLVPFVSVDPQSMTSSYGLAPASELVKGTYQQVTRQTSTEQILSYDVDPKATVVYVTCPQDRNELCSLRIKHKGKWHVDKNGAPFELKVLARSRRERGAPNKSQRLIKDGDTPQGIYHLWGTMFTEHRKFGAVPRIDIDGMQPPLNFEHAHSPNFTRVVPRQVFQDYWVHEFPLSFALGRYLFRIHDNSVDPDFPDTYTTPKTQKTFRASAGCINTGSNMDILLSTLQKMGVVDKKQISTQKRYGRLEIQNVQDAFLIVLDEPDTVL